MPSARYVPRPYVPEVYDSPNLVRLAELARASGYTQAERARTQGAQSAQGWARLGDLVVNALQGIQGDKAQKQALAQRIVEKAKDDQLQRDKLDEEINARKGQQQWQRDQFRVGTADAAADVMTPGQSVDPATFGQRFAGTPSEVRFSHDPAREALLPATSMADTGGVPGFAVRPDQIDQQPFETMAGPSMSTDTAARPERYTRKPLFTESLAVENLQRQKEAAAAAAGNTVADNKRADAAARATEAYRASQLGISRQRLAAEQAKAAASAGDKTDLTPAGIDAAALNYAKTGQLPPLGMGDKTTRKQIINRAAEMMPGLDIASAKADFAANEGSLKQLQKQRDAISAFENTAKKNIDIFLESAGKVVDTGSPLANTAARYVSGKMLGSADQAQYDASRQVALNEIAKIITNPNLNGQLSDSARHEVEAFNPNSATLKQSVAVMRLLKRDMDNRTQSLDEQLSGIRQRIKKGADTTPATAPKVEEWVRDAAGNFVKKGGG